LNSIIVHLIQLFIQFLIKLHLIFIQLVGIFFKLLLGIILLLSLILMCLIDILLWSLINLITLILYVWFFKTLTVIVYFRYWYVWWVEFLFLIWMIKLCSIVHVIYMAFVLNWWTRYYFCLIYFVSFISNCLYNLGIYCLILWWHFQWQVYLLLRIIPLWLLFIATPKIIFWIIWILKRRTFLFGIVIKRMYIRIEFISI